MKNLVTILVGVFIALFVFLAICIGFFRYYGSGLDISSNKYVKKIIPEIASSWNSQVLIKSSSVEFKKKASEAQIDQLFFKLSRLGALSKIEISKGNCRMGYTSGEGLLVTAHYQAVATFAHGEANFTINLIQHNGQWQILGFFVDSP